MMDEVEIVARAFCQAAGINENALISRAAPLQGDGLGYFMSADWPPKPAWEHFRYHAVCALQALAAAKETAE